MADHIGLLMWMLGTGLRSSGLQGMHFTDGALSTTLWVYF